MASAARAMPGSFSPYGLKGEEFRRVRGDLNEVEAMKIRTPGRNEPCRCGSHKKYKKCCLPRDSEAAGGIPRIIEQLNANREFGAAWHERHGLGKPIIHANFQGTKLVAVGNSIYYSEFWKTFPDFLSYFLRSRLGVQWGSAELQRPEGEQHPLIVLYRRAMEFANSLPRGKDGLFKNTPTGPLLAWLSLAYDLYLVSHEGRIESRLLKRLRHRDQFQGARYELFVTATFIRAGFKVTPEDESDGSSKHPEFVAHHLETGEVVAVEAKSRHRPGVLGRRGEFAADVSPKAGIASLLEDALKKAPTDKAYIVAIDVNLPAEDRFPLELPWVYEVAGDLSSREAAFSNEAEPFTMILFTNHGFHFGNDNEPALPTVSLAALAKKPRVPFRYPGLAKVIVDAAEKSLNIPSFFPETPTTVR